MTEPGDGGASTTQKGVFVPGVGHSRAAEKLAKLRARTNRFKSGSPNQKKDAKTRCAGSSAALRQKGRRAAQQTARATHRHGSPSTDSEAVVPLTPEGTAQGREEKAVHAPMDESGAASPCTADTAEMELEHLVREHVSLDPKSNRARELAREVRERTGYPFGIVPDDCFNAKVESALSPSSKQAAKMARMRALFMELSPALSALQTYKQREEDRVARATGLRVAEGGGGGPRYFDANTGAPVSPAVYERRYLAAIGHQSKQLSERTDSVEPEDIVEHESYGGGGAYAKSPEAADIDPQQRDGMRGSNLRRVRKSRRKSLVLPPAQCPEAEPSTGKAAAKGHEKDLKGNSHSGSSSFRSPMCDVSNRTPEGHSPASRRRGAIDLEKGNAQRRKGSAKSTKRRRSLVVPNLHDIESPTREASCEPSHGIPKRTSGCRSDRTHQLARESQAHGGQGARTPAARFPSSDGSSSGGDAVRSSAVQSDILKAMAVLVETARQVPGATEKSIYELQQGLNSIGSAFLESCQTGAVVEPSPSGTTSTWASPAATPGAFFCSAHEAASTERPVLAFVPSAIDDPTESFEGSSSLTSARHDEESPRILFSTAGN